MQGSGCNGSKRWCRAAGFHKDSKRVKSRVRRKVSLSAKVPKND